MPRLSLEARQSVAAVFRYTGTMGVAMSVFGFLGGHWLPASILLAVGVLWFIIGTRMGQA